MNGRRTLRLAWVGLCNGFLFLCAAKVLIDIVSVGGSHFPPEDILVSLFAANVCVASVVGFTLELLKHRLAKPLNISTPACVGVLMATSIIWLPMLASHEPNGLQGEAAEGAGFLVILSLIPICLAAITGMAYWAIDIAPDRTSTTLGL